VVLEEMESVGKNKPALREGERRKGASFSSFNVCVNRQ